MFPTINVFRKVKKSIIFFHLKINIFTAVKYNSIMYGHVFVITFASRYLEKIRI